MISEGFASISIGIGIGFIYSLLFINFDATWKKSISFLIGTGGSGGIVSLCFNQFGIVDNDKRMTFVGLLVIAIVVTFIISLLIIGFLIKDKDEKNYIRIRDILLGQKAYIEKYYESRAKEIDEKLNYDTLKKREVEVQEKESHILKREEACVVEENRLKNEQEKLLKIGKKNLKVIIPDKKAVFLNQSFIETLPSYTNDLIYTYIAIKKSHDEILKKESIDRYDLKAYFLTISTYIMDFLFESGEIRVHFRKYDFRTEMYEIVCALTGVNKRPEQKLTPIPFKDSMIEKSFRCRRGMIKSVNPEADYHGNHNTKWKDYLTLTFWNIIHEEKPVLTMGISVRNTERYKKLFYFLEYIEFDIFINDCIEDLENKFSVSRLLIEDR